MTWLDIFDREFANHLNPRSSGAKRGLVEGHIQRADGFRLIFELMLAQHNGPFNIIETGTLRNPGNWKDGQSALLFTEFTKIYGGSVRSVDIDPKAVATAQQALPGPNFNVTCSDSVAWLGAQADLDRVDLFYLDSWDVVWEKDEASAEHHLKEFVTIEPFIHPGCVIAIDDNSRFLHDNSRTGKGRRIVEYLDSQGRQPILDAYQIIYQF